MRQICFILFLIIIQSLSAQKMTVESFAADPTDLSASMQRRNDANGDACALVKVLLARDGATFLGNVVGQVTYSQSEYLVYMTKGSKRLEIKLDNVLPLKIMFEDYNISSLETMTTYELIITLPNIKQSIGVSNEKNINSLPEPLEIPSIDTIKVYDVNGVSFRMIHVNGGTFEMGATKEQKKIAEKNEKPIHEVTLSDYMICETEVTQALWTAVMGSTIEQLRKEEADRYYWGNLEEINSTRQEFIENNYPLSGVGADFPMYYISFEDCQKFIERINEITGLKFRLPTEAEWEFAARGGMTDHQTMFAGSQKIDDVAWFYENSFRTSHKIKTKSPNKTGIYDMSGNVAEYCSDGYHPYSKDAQTNPTVRILHNVVLRGGDWDSKESQCRTSSRSFIVPTVRHPRGGFRLAL